MKSFLIMAIILLGSAICHAHPESEISEPIELGIIAVDSEHPETHFLVSKPVAIAVMMGVDAEMIYLVASLDHARVATQRASESIQDLSEALLTARKIEILDYDELRSWTYTLPSEKIQKIPDYLHANKLRSNYVKPGKPNLRVMQRSNC